MSLPKGFDFMTIEQKRSINRIRKWFPNMVVMKFENKYYYWEYNFETKKATVMRKSRDRFFKPN